MLYRLRGLLKPFYNAYHFSLFRGKTLLHDKNQQALCRLQWLTRSTKTSGKHFLEFAKVNKDFVATHCSVKIQPAEFVGVISSKYDTVVKPVVKDSVQCDAFVELEVNHMSILEQPRMIADVIADRR